MRAGRLLDRTVSQLGSSAIETLAKEKKYIRALAGRLLNLKTCSQRVVSITRKKGLLRTFRCCTVRRIHPL